MELETLSTTNWGLNRNVVILGDGYMGNHLYNHLTGDGFNVIKKSSRDLNYHDPKVLYKYLLGLDTKVTVINCSGFTGKPNIDEAESRKEECWELNVMSPLRVNAMCDKAGVNYIHISSGCVFDGYQKNWSEEDKPNYGIFENHSSFYSKSKHAFEMHSQDMNGKILRIRMPFTRDNCYRNYLNKIARYTDLIDFKNSKTYIPDLCGVVSKMVGTDDGVWIGRDTYNIVNPEPLWTREVCDIMKSFGRQNNNWKYVSLRDIGTIAGRSNCVMSHDKVNKIFPMKTETQALMEIFESWK